MGLVEHLRFPDLELPGNGTGIDVREGEVGHAAKMAAGGTGAQDTIEVMSAGTVDSRHYG
ncbi:hypothetical protein [uncultured Sphingomonas sp.]|uniref:hypothetical protein n=1 Tax=uncultured Sphingomonas sp. TaxID=158754 RepID=UPI0025F9E603|nr:hypothetical protein [uncultured Sphingomonas sp.]